MSKSQSNRIVSSFRTPNLYFSYSWTIQCKCSNPLCLLTSSPTPSQPSEPIRLHRGFNLVTMYLVMTTSLVRSSMFSAPLWLEGNEICPGVHVISRPITQPCFSSQQIIPEPPPAMHCNYPKCRTSHMLSEPEPPLQPNGLLVSQIPSSLSDFDLPDFSTVFTTVLVRSTKNHAILPQNVNVGIIRPQTSENEATFLMLLRPRFSVS